MEWSTRKNYWKKRIKVLASEDENLEEMHVAAAYLWHWLLKRAIEIDIHELTDFEQGQALKYPECSLTFLRRKRMDIHMKNKHKENVESLIIDSKTRAMLYFFYKGK